MATLQPRPATLAADLLGMLSRSTVGLEDVQQRYDARLVASIYRLAGLPLEPGTPHHFELLDGDTPEREAADKALLEMSWSAHDDDLTDEELTERLESELRRVASRLPADWAPNATTMSPMEILAGTLCR